MYYMTGLLEKVFITSKCIFLQTMKMFMNVYKSEFIVLN